MDWLVRFDVVVLGLLLACTVVIMVRVFRLYHAARLAGDSRSTGKKLISELNIQVCSLKSISCAAPYIGLVGTCLGILNAFPGVGMEKHAYIAMTTSRLAAALVPAATGILVAIPATSGYEYGRTRLDLLVNDLPGRKRLLLTSRFTGSPSFAVIAAPGLAVLVGAFMTFASFHAPTGLDVGIALGRCGDAELSDRLTLLHITNGRMVFINREEQDWSTLQSRLSEIYSPRAQRIIYVLADEELRFQTVADAIDLINNVQEVGTSRPLNITVRLLTPSRCPEPVLIPVRRYPSR